jgi:hypothetical protein
MLRRTGLWLRWLPLLTVLLVVALATAGCGHSGY